MIKRYFKKTKMKNKILFLLAFLSSLQLSFADDYKPVFSWSWLTTDGVKEAIKDSNVGIWTSDRLWDVILWYVDYFMPFLWIFAFVALVYAWFLYVTSAANEENADKAKNIIIYVATWVILVFLSYSIVSLLFNV